MLPTGYKYFLCSDWELQSRLRQACPPPPPPPTLYFYQSLSRSGCHNPIKMDLVLSLMVSYQAPVCFKVLKTCGSPVRPSVLAEVMFSSIFLLPGMQVPRAADSHSWSSWSFLGGRQKWALSSLVWGEQASLCTCRMAAVLQRVPRARVFMPCHQETCTSGAGGDLLCRYFWHWYCSLSLPRGSSGCYRSDWHSCEHIQGSCLYM